MGSVLKTIFSKSPLLLLAIISCLPAKGFKLVDFKTGAATTSEQLLKERKTLIFIEKDCLACKHYLKKISLCPEKLKENLAYISVSTPVKTKELTTILPPNAHLYLLNEIKKIKSIRGTPTTLGNGQQILGPLNCEEIEHLRK